MKKLEDIVAHKRAEVEERKSLYPLRLLERSIYAKAQPVSLRKYLLRPDLNGIIAEFKRKSPSKGYINEFARAEEVCLSYMQAGASALSVLTDAHFFGAQLNDLGAARKFNFCPILRKDFIVDAYQVVESRSMGADAILLIAAILSSAQMDEFFALACELGMEVLFEIHHPDEVQKLPSSADIIGVNCRNLQDFSINPQLHFELMDRLPAQALKVAESGMASPHDVEMRRQVGYQGFLIGESFMKEANPGKACASFIRQLKSLKKCASKSVV